MIDYDDYVIGSLFTCIYKNQQYTISPILNSKGEWKIKRKKNKQKKA